MGKKFGKKDAKYLLYFLYIPVYAVWFALVEKHITAGYFVSYMKLDDYIPFVEYFYIFYFSWYFFLAGITVYLLLVSRQDFARFMQFIIIGATAGLIVFTIFPNGQDLRPTVFERENFFTKNIGGLYAIDTNTNVLPSLHVVGSIAGAAALSMVYTYQRKFFRQLCVWVWCALICLSTVFIKQHSFLDVIAGIALCVPVYFIVYTNILRVAINPFNKNKVRFRFYKSAPPE